jgi:hypothetical protein
MVGLMSKGSRELVSLFHRVEHLVLDAVRGPTVLGCLGKSCSASSVIIDHFPERFVTLNGDDVTLLLEGE